MTESPVATRFLSLAELLDLYGRIFATGGGASAIRDLGLLESALAQPHATFENEVLYPTLVEKAAGGVGRDEFATWIRKHLIPRESRDQ